MSEIVKRLRELLAQTDRAVLNRAPLPWAICSEPPNDAWYKGITIYANRDGPGVGIRVADLAPLKDDDDNAAIGGLIVETINALPALLDALEALEKKVEDARNTLVPFAEYRYGRHRALGSEPAAKELLKHDGEALMLGHFIDAAEMVRDLEETRMPSEMIASSS